MSQVFFVFFKCQESGIILNCPLLPKTSFTLVVPTRSTKLWTTLFRVTGPDSTIKFWFCEEPWTGYEGTSQGLEKVQFCDTGMLYLQFFWSCTVFGLIRLWLLQCCGLLLWLTEEDKQRKRETEWVSVAERYCLCFYATRLWLIQARSKIHAAE